MAKGGSKGVRAAFADAQNKLAREAEVNDPAPHEKRDGHAAGHWPGAPFDRLPPGCPVVPLGKDGTLSYFIDTLDQLVAVARKDWGGNAIHDLFAMTPNYPLWAWPRWSKPTKGGTSEILGVDVTEAAKCLLKAAARRGLFDPSDRVRGRGAWTAGERLLWHSGDALWIVENGKLKQSEPGEIGGQFYPRRPPIMEPWPEPVTPDDGPAQEIFKALRTWSFERGAFDAVIVTGGIGCMLLGGALPYRPHMALMGDFGVGKTELQRLIKTVCANALQHAGNATEASIRQRLGLDCLPVSLDEFEATTDNERARKIIDLSRLAYDGHRLWRGGADHKGVEFQARNTFLCSGIQLPPMGAADRSRFAVLNLGKIDEKRMGAPPTVDGESGRMILRALMDSWPEFLPRLTHWRATLRLGGLSDRAQNTYGTLFAVAELLLGYDTMKAAGLPLDDEQALAELVASATVEERQLQKENWRDALETLLGTPVPSWKGGEKASVGAVLEAVEGGSIEVKYARERLAVAGLGLIEEGDEELPFGERRCLLAVPTSHPALGALFENTRWKEGGWTGALRQGISAGVVRPKPKNVKITRTQCWCYLVDLKEYDRLFDDR